MNSKKVFFIFLIVAAHNAHANDIIDLIKPTGSWYEHATAKIHQLDGCDESNSTATFTYKNLYSSLIETKNRLYHENYKGGTCEESIVNDTLSEPDDWPIVVDHRVWPEYKRQNPNALIPKIFFYNCTNHLGIPYMFSFRIQPQYQCVDGSCNSYKKACAGDVYAGDLLQKPVELLGHTGLIYTSQLDSAPEASNMVIEVLNTPPIIHSDKNLADIQKDRPVWGVRYGVGNIKKGEITATEAGKMLHLGLTQSQYCPQYTVLPIYHLGGPETITINNPLIQKSKQIITSNCAEFRCDTFVKYLYKAVLGTELPPYNPTQMPKDLFNAFPYQRGEIPPILSEYIFFEPNPIVSLVSNDRISWQSFKNANQSISEKLYNLESIININAVSFHELIEALKIENDVEIKTRLLYLIQSKFKLNSQITKQDWITIARLSDDYIKLDTDAKVIVNSLLIKRLMLQDEALILLLESLNLRINQEFDKQNALFVNKSIDLVLFELIINNPKPEILQKISGLLNHMDHERIIKSFSLLVNDYPLQLNRLSKKLIYNCVAKVESGYFTTPNPVENKVRAKAWANALMKLQSNVKDEDTFYKALASLNDPYIIAVFILENKKILNDNQKSRLLLLLNNNKSSLNMSLDAKDRKKTMIKAIDYLSHNRQ
jgi:hypothetical protein